MLVCSVCGAKSELSDTQIWHREISICPDCNSTPRFCGVALAIALGISEDVAGCLSALPVTKHLSGVGISDASVYADILSDKLSYTNTYYHTEPHLDLESRSSCSQYSDLDLIVCSDVIEHTREPPFTVLANLAGMLRRGGALVLSAPTHQMPITIEWYPSARSLEIFDNDGGRVVRWTNAKGVEYVDTAPDFHGGPGDTLEMRLISHQELCATARAIGFDVMVVPFDKTRGYYWPLFQANHLLPGRPDSRVLLLRRS